MASLTNMVKRCMGLIGTKDVTDWEDSFLQSIAKQTNEGDNTKSLSEKQIDVVERIFKKNFAD